MRHTTRTLAAALALVGLAGLSACGGGSKDDSSAAKDDTSTTAGATADCTASPGTTVTVEIGDFKFDPTPVKVKTCDSVVWKNVHTQAHTSSGDGDKSWNTGNIQAGESSKAILFDEAGTLSYKCALHPFMKGVVEVS
jgi:plastocyanin